MKRFLIALVASAILASPASAIDFVLREGKVATVKISGSEFSWSDRSKNLGTYSVDGYSSFQKDNCYGDEFCTEEPTTELAPFSSEYYSDFVLQKRIADFPCYCTGDGIMNFRSLSGSVTIFGVSNVSFAPEPASWGMMVLGFGLAGASIRIRCRDLLVA